MSFAGRDFFFSVLTPSGFMPGGRDLHGGGVQ